MTNPNISDLRAKLNTSHDLQSVKFEDAFLVKFLRARRGNVNGAYGLISDYLGMKKKNPQLFLAPSKVRNVFEDNICCILPYRNKTKETLVLLRPGNWDPSKYNAQHVISASVSLYEHAALSRDTQIHGFVSIVDMRNSGTRQLLGVTLESIKLAAEMTERALPIRFEKIHVVHQNKVASIVYSIAKPFLSEDLRQRIVFHGDNLEQLHKEVSPNALPVDLGGTLRDYHAIMYYTKLRRSEEELKKIWRMKV